MNFPNKIQQLLKDKKCVRDTLGMSDAGVYLYEDVVLKVQKTDMQSDNEAAMLQWLDGKMPVPRVIEYIQDNEYSYILMNKCAGLMGCDPYYMNQPKRLVGLLAETMHSLWNIPIADCPYDFTLEQRLKLAEENIIHNRVDINNAQPDTFGPKGFRDPEELLHWLKENKPTETKVFCHGDFCLPNIFLSNSGVTGLIDLGRAGVADPWLDIALCHRSLANNYSGIYGGKSYPGYNGRMLFDALNIQLDMERVRYYILLDELF